MVFQLLKYCMLRHVSLHIYLDFVRFEQNLVVLAYSLSPAKFDILIMAKEPENVSLTICNHMICGGSRVGSIQTANVKNL